MPSVEIRGVELDHERRGSGPTMIWGHGLTSSRADEAVPPILVDWQEATGHIDVVRYDLASSIRHHVCILLPKPADCKHIALS